MEKEQLTNYDNTINKNYHTSYKIRKYLLDNQKESLKKFYIEDMDRKSDKQR